MKMRTVLAQTVSSGNYSSNTIKLTSSLVAMRTVRIGARRHKTFQKMHTTWVYPPYLANQARRVGADPVAGRARTASRGRRARRPRKGPADQRARAGYGTFLTYVHTYIHTYIHAYMHTYIHTYIQIYIIYTKVLMIVLESSVLFYRDAMSNSPVEAPARGAAPGANLLGSAPSERSAATRGLHRSRRPRLFRLLGTLGALGLQGFFWGGLGR